MSGAKPDWEGAFKISREHRYFNISVLWIFYYKHVIKLLYYARVPHEVVTLSSLACGIAGGVFLLRPGYPNLLIAALFIHAKDLLDACDGSLARLTNRSNRIARFLDSLCDFAAITWLMAALSIAMRHKLSLWAYIAAAGAWFSVFIQCSYFNYYLVKYSQLYRKTNVRCDESLTGEDREFYDSKTKRSLLILLQRIYGIVYGWQDRLIARIDKISITRVYGENYDLRDPVKAGSWYGDKGLMTMNSALCFGTHLFILILLALFSRPRYFYYVVITAGNIYLGANIIYRIVKLGGRFRPPETAGRL